MAEEREPTGAPSRGRRSRWALLALLAACGGSTPTGGAPRDQPLRLTWAPAAVGDVEVSDDQGTSLITFEPPGAPAMTMTIRNAEETRIEVLEADRGLWRKVQVEYVRDEQIQEMGGQTETARGVLHGNTYVFWKEGDQPRATRRDGAAVDGDELAGLVEDLDDEVGRMPGMAQVIAMRAWTVGEPYQLTAADLDRLARRTALGEMVPERGAVTLVERTAEVATFEVEMTTRSTSPQAELAIDVELTAKVEIARLRPVAIATRGQIAGTINGVRATGTMEGTETLTYP